VRGRPHKFCSAFGTTQSKFFDTEVAWDILGRLSLRTGERESAVAAPLRGVLQNDTAPMIIDNTPFFDLLQGSKAAEADKVIIQAAISYARGSSGVVDVAH
jgi:hypothetical protein